MQTTLPEAFSKTPAGQRAERELRTCVHCGFCNATCPTYRLTGDELDGPRGRIFLVKEFLETGAAGPRTLEHLDRCLSCRACETTCPSGVNYHVLLDHGRAAIAAQTPRPPLVRIQRALLRAVLPHRRRVAALVALARPLSRLLPARIAQHLPPAAPPAPRMPAHARKVVLMQGCVEPVVAPGIGRAAAMVLDRLGIEAVTARNEGCCGALPHHLDDHDASRRMARTNIEAWERALAAGAETVVVPSSGCHSFVREYPDLFDDDPAMQARARRVVERVGDLSAVIEPELARLPRARARRVALHAPCSLQHALREDARVARVLAGFGYELVPVAEANQCCGSAGSYSLLQPEMAGRLRQRKLDALAAAGADACVTANVGCRAQLSTEERPVGHWIELLAAELAARDR